MKQNVTLALGKDSLRKVKILAAKRDTSVTRLLADQLARVVAEDDEYEPAKSRALKRMKKGFHLGGRILATREELHARKG